MSDIEDRAIAEQKKHGGFEHSLAKIMTRIANETYGELGISGRITNVFTITQSGKFRRIGP